jgi:chromosome partitioning protein
MLKTIAISNEKGGVAKTTTTLSLGAALVELGNRVLLIDLDAQANLTLALGFEPGENENTSSNVMLDNIPLLNACKKTDVEKLDIIPSSSRIEISEQFLPVRNGYTTILQKAIRSSLRPAAHPHPGRIFFRLRAAKHDVAHSKYSRTG